MVVLINPRIWLFTGCIGITVVMLALGYLLRESRRRSHAQVKLITGYKERLQAARQVQDSLVQSLHILVLRFHCAAELVRADDPASAILRGELERADKLIVEARTNVEGLTSKADTTVVTD